MKFWNGNENGNENESERGIYLRSRSKAKYEILKWKWKWTQMPMLECAIAPPKKVAVNKVLMQYGIFSAVYKCLLSLKTKLISSIVKIRHWERECIFYFWTWTRCHVVAAAVTSLQTIRCRIQICKLVSWSAGQLVCCTPWYHCWWEDCTPGCTVCSVQCKTRSCLKFLLCKLVS